ncbi:hypothetical protein [Actinomadura rupiterrae]|uniref:hypothetical protein n=1 Tax=Actinomadura rupiterrae TaxID=559627 RepID=UPI0020A56EB6|nr:hypothetical protein [Actinomadura rupiterrae]MCP2338657.1 hypothetical protein [Actinomadura rupiterrae]
MTFTDEQTQAPAPSDRSPSGQRPAGRAGTVSWFGPDRPVLRFITAAWLILNMVNVTVWAAVCVTGLHWESPWWLWTFAPPGAVLAGLWWLTDTKRS